MKRLIIPKSVQDSQRYISWAFPALLGFGAASIPFTDGLGTVALVVAMLVVITGWLSFGMIQESQYNDALFVVDLSLLTVYCVILHYCRAISSNNYTSDPAIFNFSGTVFLLYSIWDIIALCGRDTAAVATGAHLARFAKICFLIAIVFFSLGYLSFSLPSWASTIGIEPSTIRLVGLIIWGGILVWWHIGRFRAALQDSDITQNT